MTNPLSLFTIRLAIRIEQLRLRLMLERRGRVQAEVGVVNARTNLALAERRLVAVEDGRQLDIILPPPAGVALSVTVAVPKPTPTTPLVLPVTRALPSPIGRVQIPQHTSTLTATDLNDAVGGLKALGYNAGIARAACVQVGANARTVEELVAMALQVLDSQKPALVRRD